MKGLARPAAESNQPERGGEASRRTWIVFDCEPDARCYPKYSYHVPIAYLRLTLLSKDRYRTYYPFCGRALHLQSRRMNDHAFVFGRDLSPQVTDTTRVLIDSSLTQAVAARRGRRVKEIDPESGGNANA